MMLERESEVLSLETRKQIVEFIQSTKNVKRKHEAFKRYECYKDQTDKYVIELLKNTFSEKTVTEMSYAIPNIPLVRKIVDKLARVYSNGVKRSSNNRKLTLTIEELTKELDVNSAMKKQNRFLKLQKNGMIFPRPYPVYTINPNGIEEVKYDIALDVLLPFLYDVIPNKNNPTQPMVLILSDYETGETVEHKEYIVWTNNYHFTMNEEGVIVQGDGVNPIGTFPGIDFAIDRDGSFWATGGNDLVDGSIKINAVIANVNHIAVVQGYGQFWVKGSDLQKSYEMGPNKAILLEYKEVEGQAEPEIGFATANPPLDQLRQLFETYIALLLTSNNLSTSGISAQLSGGIGATAAVSLLVDKAESVEDVRDQEQIFHDKEPLVWELVGKWLNVYGTKKLLVPRLQKFSLPESFDVNLKFDPPSAIMTENERLNNIKLRKELGINTMIELIQKDDPSLDEKQAEEKLQKLMDEKLSAIAALTIDEESEAGEPIEKVKI